MNKALLGLLGAAASGGAGYGLGYHVQKGKAKESIARAKQSSELANKLRDRSESANRRLKVENYYVRQALNELAQKVRSKNSK